MGKSADRREPAMPPEPTEPAGGESGQSLVEFSLILTVFMLLLLGVMDLGRGVYNYNVLSNVAREGARYGSLLQVSGTTPTRITTCDQLYDTPVSRLAIGLYGSRDEFRRNVAMKSFWVDATDPTLFNSTVVAANTPGVADKGSCVQPAYPPGKGKAYYVVFKAWHQFRAITPMIDAVRPGGFPLSATSVMKVTYSAP